MRIAAAIPCVLLFSCAASPEAGSSRSSREATLFFEDYVRSDGPSRETLPVFLQACGGDHAALDAVFSDYSKYGSGDNEAWGDVPDVILKEVGDSRFAAYLESTSPETRSRAVEWLGAPGRSLMQDTAARRRYPLTAAIQQRAAARE